MGIVDPFENQESQDIVDPFDTGSVGAQTTPKEGSLLSKIGEALDFLKGKQGDLSSLAMSPVIGGSGGALAAVYPEKTSYGQFQRGLTSGALEFPRQLSNILPGVNIPRAKFGGEETIPYKIGEYAGEAVDYLGLSELAPVLGLTKLANPVGRTLGSAGYGAIMNPEDRSSGALAGLGAGAISEAVPFVAKGSDFFRPDKFARKIAESFSPEKLKQTSKEGMKLYDDVFSGIKDNPLYNGNSSMEYLQLPEDQVKNAYNIDLRKMHDRFLKNPTLSNAHELQSQLGTEIRDLHKMKDRLGALPQADRNTLISYEYAQDLLNKDIDSFLVNAEKGMLPRGAGDTGLLEKHRIAKENWAKNVIPERNASMLMSKLGKNYSAEQMLRTMEKAENKGIELPDRLEGQLSSLKNKITSRNYLQGLLGALIGGGAGSMYGGGAADVVGALGGATIGGKLINALVKNVKLPPETSNFIDNMLSKAYRPIGKSVIANLLPEEENDNK